MNQRHQLIHMGTHSSELHTELGMALCGGSRNAIFKEIRTDLLGEWCPTNHEYVVNQLYSISHSMAQRVGFNSEFKAKNIQVVAKRELLGHPGGNNGMSHSVKILHLCPWKSVLVLALVVASIQGGPQ